jgi:hypothetical protein
MTQDLIWEQYRYPVGLEDLLAGNGGEMALQANPVVRREPPSQPEDDVLINMTGSTNGFGGHSRQADRHRDPGQQELSDRRPRDRRLGDPDAPCGRLGTLKSRPFACATHKRGVGVSA